MIRHYGRYAAVRVGVKKVVILVFGPERSGVTFITTPLVGIEFEKRPQTR